jgi:hypothetical protein
MFIRERQALPDGPTARGAATSWRVYRSGLGLRLGASRCSALDEGLDAVVVASPVHDALFDGFGLEVLR